MFATLVATYEKGFLLILEPFESEAATVPNPVLHFTCLDASIAIKPVFDRFSSVIITSGTISPLDMYPRMLQFDTVVQQSYSMSLARQCFLPLIITRGSDQVAISSKFEVRNDPSVVRNYGQILIEFSKITPDGLLCFFPSYLYLETITSTWASTVLHSLNEVANDRVSWMKCGSINLYWLRHLTPRKPVLLSTLTGRYYLSNLS